MISHNRVDDDQLISLFLDGDTEAFRALLYRHKDSIFQYIYYIVKDYDLANDFFQETFIKAINLIRAERYVARGYFYSWICRLAHNMIIDHYRKQAQKQQLSISDSCVANQVSNIRQEANIDDLMIHTDTECELHTMIDMLPEEQKEIVRLRFFEGMSFKEISEALDISINTALGRARYSILNLRKMASKHNLGQIYK